MAQYGSVSEVRREHDRPLPHPFFCLFPVLQQEAETLALVLLQLAHLGGLQWHPLVVSFCEGWAPEDKLGLLRHFHTSEHMRVGQLCLRGAYKVTSQACQLFVS